MAIAWLYGPIAAGAPAVETARRVMVASVLMLIVMLDDRRGDDGRVAAARRRDRPRGEGLADDLGGRTAPRSPKHRAPRASGPNLTRPSGRRRSRLSARRNGTSAGTTSAVAGRRSFADRERARARDEIRDAEIFDRSSSARCVDDSRTDGSPCVRIASNAANTSAVGDGDGGRDEQDAGCPVEAVERRDELAAALDQRRAARARKNGTSEPSRAATASRRGSVELGAPRLERAIEGRRRIRRPAGEPGRHRDPLLEAGGQRRRRRRTAGPATTDRVARGGERPQDEVVGRWARVEARDVERVRRPAGRREAQPVGEGQRGEDRMERRGTRRRRRPTTASVS